MNSIIFIGGIHGSGKGTVCNKIISEFKITHLTASEVLKWTEIKKQNEKVVENIIDTQEKLIYNLNKIIKKDTNYLLDGHYCLINKNNEPEKIPLEVFRKIAPKKLILVVAPITEIKLRLENRDNKEYNLDFIEAFQNLEISFSKEISESLDIPLFIFDGLGYNYENLFNFIQ